MAKGLKIAHEQSDGTKLDQRIGSNIYQGAVGGIPQWVTVDGVRTLKVAFRTDANVFHGNGYIIAQKGASQFLVANAVGAVTGATHSNASVTVCTLTNVAQPANVFLAGNTTQLSAASTMVISGYTTANTAFAAKRITSKHVYDFSGNKYRYRHAATQVATSTFANVIVH
ncbi:hypothetical protein UFOVP112_147 [uncultured Caudovirales phage]|uniref:Uncharacterized protein n=1 Tax=uncultured Caudovirales phage TaxID=2100421 RepID=A0A6J5LBB1_9CAUD|nr:hypothetical protein UFOVP112_147 [uncultured Caudovirales phage]